MAEPRPRRGHGEDSIYFDQANNHWVGAVSLGYKAGKRVRKTVTGRTKTAVKAKLRQLRQELDNAVARSRPGLRIVDRDTARSSQCAARVQERH